ncbi:MAG: molybdopterin molybdotransferase MoeA [Planctomycetota bacterium]|nr:molybdopterin molybdotransferase MoeA [Planctomycetota bacterium]
MDGKETVTFEEAISLVREYATGRRGTERVALSDAVGRVLAEDIVSDTDLPPFDKSAMDGYAIRSGDATTVPVELSVVEHIPAGNVSNRAIGRLECARIMTGAPLPPGADAVVRQEDTEPAGPGRIRVTRPVARGDNVCVRGEDIRGGSVVLRSGMILRPLDIALAAAAGAPDLNVRTLPTVAVAATGNEVVPAGCPLREGAIRDSNSYSLAARLRQTGIRPKLLGIIPDDPEALRRALNEGLGADLLLVSGGVSVGDCDLAPAVLSSMGVEIVFRSVAMKPGRPTVFGRKGSSLVFGVPGNPVSTVIVAELFVIPAVRLMMGESDAGPVMTDALLDEALSHKPDRMSFKPVRLYLSGGTLRARPTTYHGSADLAGAAAGDAFAVIPRGVPRLEAGATVRILTFPDDWRRFHTGQPT